jgi:hypothetical protein
MASLTIRIGKLVKDFVVSQFDEPFSPIYGARLLDASPRDAATRFAVRVEGDREIIYEVRVKALGFRKVQ